jgi:hypothetical protein
MLTDEQKAEATLTFAMPANDVAITANFEGREEIAHDPSDEGAVSAGDQEVPVALEGQGL